MEFDTIDPSMKEVNRQTLSGWVAFFYVSGGLQRYTHETHNWADLPSTGVQFMYRIYSGYNESNSGTDYYCPYNLTPEMDINSWIKFGYYADDNVYNTEIWPVIKDDPVNNRNGNIIF